MNFRTYLYGPLCAMAAVAMVACSDDLEQDGRIPQGNGIVFGASAGYAGDSGKRTAYGDYVQGENGPVGQAIEWVATDKVEIYSPQSPNAQQVQYGINFLNGNSAYLVAETAVGLQWAGGTEQNFYAVYPAPASMSNAAVQQLVSFQDGTLTGYIPVNQAHTITRSANSYTATPVMDYQYMVATNSVNPVETQASGGAVPLAFTPLVTTLEVTIHGTAGSANTPIVQLNVFDRDGNNIAGNFTCDLTAPLASDGYPTCEYKPSATVRDMITISTYWRESENSDNVPLTLGEGQSITFNIFLLPHEDMDNISLRVVGLNTTGKEMSLTYEGQPIVLHPHKKTRIEVNAPSFGTGDTNNWISVLDDNVLVSQLSIPGTTNSYSYNYEGDKVEMYRTQMVDIERQWNSGIRCFELKCPNSSGNSLDGVELQCNGANLGVTFGAAVDAIWNKVKDTDEFAMIIPFFESQAGRGGNVTDFANDLNQFFRTHSYKYVTYGSELTLGDARGSLMFVARITSEEDSESIRSGMPKPEEGVFIDQWGTLKDNWWRRGYAINGIAVQNWATTATYNNPSETPTMEYYLMNGNENKNWIPTTLPTKGEVNYVRASVREDGSQGQAYVQDWSRVVGQPGNVWLYEETRWNDWSPENFDQYFYWPESYSEKIGDVWTTFERSIQANAKDGTYQGLPTFFINSLDGYFVDYDDVQYDEGLLGNITGVDANNSNSPFPFIDGGDGVGNTMWSGGGRGDIASYAEQINNDFYNRILDYGEDNIYGSMNVVLMDRVYEGNGGTYLPSVIINNNFRFPLRTGNGSTTAETSYNASYKAPVNAIN